MIEDDVGINLYVALVGVVGKVSQRGARAIGCGDGSALGDVAVHLKHDSSLAARLLRIANSAAFAQIVEAVADVAAAREQPAGSGRFRGRRNPEPRVADFGKLRQSLVHLVPTRLEPLEYDFGLRADCHGRKECDKRRFQS